MGHKYIDVFHGYRKSKVFQNIFWLILDKVVKLIVAVFVLGRVANYLKAYDFGILNFGIAITSIFAPLVSFGLDNVGIKYLLSQDKDRDETLSTIFYTKLFLSWIIYLICIVVWQSNKIEVSSLYIFLLSAILLFLPFDVIDLYYQAKIKSKIPVSSRLIVFSLFACVKLLMVFYQMPFAYFVWITAIESMFVGITLFCVYWYFENLMIFRFSNFSMGLFKVMAKESIPILMSSVLIALYLKLDQIILGNSNLTELGYYAAATRLSEIWYAIPMLLMSTYYPILIEKYHVEDKVEFDHLAQKLFSFMFLVSILISLFVTIFANELISLVFGESFIGSVLILRVHIWANVFVYLGVFANFLFLVQGKVKLTLYATLLGLFINIIFNIILIPFNGGFGAAIATLISYMAVSLSSLLIFTNNFKYFKNMFLFLRENKLFTFKNLII